MTDTRSNILGRNSTFTDDPEQVAVVVDRKVFISWVLDKTGVPVDVVSAPALLELAVGHYMFMNTNPMWVARMLRELAAKIELVNTKSMGKPN